MKISNAQKIVLIIIILILIILFYLSFRKSTLTGFVVEKYNKNVALTDVKIKVDDLPEVENNNINSRYLIKDLDAGKHNITFSKDGYEIYKQEVELSSGNNNLDIELTKVENKIDNNYKYIVLTYNPKNILALNKDLKSIVYSYSFENNPINSLFIPEINKFYVICLKENNIYAFDIKTFKLIKKIPLNDYYPTGMILSNNKNSIYIYSNNAGSNNKILVFDTNNDEINSSISIKEQVLDINYSQTTGKYFILENDGLSFFDNISSEASKKIYFKQNNGYIKILNNNSSYIYILGSKSLLKIDKLSEEQTIFNNENDIFDTVIVNDKAYLLSNNKIKIINTNTMSIKGNEIDIGSINAVSMSYSIKDNKIYICDTNSQVHIFDIEQEKIISHLNINGQLNKIQAL
ncbi:MAG: hypothetical protein U0354_04315 [Candidatus Sericytochromatia bacterium]